MHYEKLYKKDQNENIREWWMETDGANYRTHSGIVGGATVTSGWKEAEGKNLGKSNETTPEQQAIQDVLSRYTFQKYQGKYYTTVEAAQDNKPAFILPMLADKYEKRKDKITFPVYAQPKLDGIRCLVHAAGMQSRSGKEILGAPHILRDLKPFFEKFPDIILDGELYNHDFRDNFNKIQSLITKKKPKPEELAESEKFTEYHIYDVIIPGTFSERYFNHSAFRLDGGLYTLDRVINVDTIRANNQQELDDAYGEWLEQGYEGQMVRLDTEYEQKRSKNLLKRKEFEDKEFKIKEIVEGIGNWAGYAKSVTIELEDGSEQSSGMRGSFEFAKQLLEEKDEYVGSEVTVRFQNRTPDGKLRFPVAVAFYKGKRDI